MSALNERRLRQAWRRAEDECTRLRAHNESLKEALLEMPFPDDWSGIREAELRERIAQAINASESMHWNDRLIAASIARTAAIHPTSHTATETRR